MSEEPSPTRVAMGRAGRRAAFHMVQALIEALKAVEAVFDEMGGIRTQGSEHEVENRKQRIEIE